MIKRIQEGIRYQKLTEEEKKQRGILGRLVGVCADFINPTRNGRGYTEQLWENVFNSDIMKEKIANKVCYGELNHPADRAEIDPEKIAVCLAEQPVKNANGQLEAVFDILDTPNGRILKTLCDYGSTLGISSRGQGDLITDENGNEIVDPDTYECECWDVVLIPAVKEARLKYVTESLDNTQVKLKQALLEDYNQANADGKRVMRDTFKELNININLNESKEDVKESNEISISDCTPVTSYEQACKLAKKYNAQWSFGNFGKDNNHEGFGTTEGYFDAYIEKGKLYIYEDGDKSFAVLVQNDGEIFGPYDINNKEIKIKLSNDLDKKDDFNDTKLIDNEGGSDAIMDESILEKKEEAPEVEVKLDDAEENIDDTLDVTEEPKVEDSAVGTDPVADDSVSLDSLVAEPVGEEPETAIEEPVADVDNSLAEIKDELEAAKETTEEGEVDPDSEFNSGIDKAIEIVSDKEATKEDSVEPVEDATEETTEEPNEESTDEISDDDKEPETDEGKEDEEPVDEALDNGSKELVRNLQEALKGKFDLENSVKSLQEQLAVSDTKVSSLTEEVEQYKAGMARLATIAKSNKDLEESISKLQESLKEKDEIINEQSLRISRLVKARKESLDKSSQLTESVSCKSKEVETLTESVSKLKEEYEGKITKLNEQLLSSAKEADQQLAVVNESLKKATTLKESYKKLANEAMNLVLEEKAKMLGITVQDIKRKLGASYTIADVNAVCEGLKSYSLNVSKLPFNMDRTVGVRVNESVSKAPINRKSANEDDDVDEGLIRLANI